MLKLENVAKRFGAREVLRDLSLEVRAGESVALVGDSGIGKSTLLNVIAGLEPVDEGRITFDGHDYAAMDDDALTLLRRRHFGFVFQAFHILPHLSVLENAALPLLLQGVGEAERAERARAALAGVGLAERAADMPRTLSGGELQRAAIARALVGAPRLVLADEPTGNLDPQNAAQVLSLLVDGSRARGAACLLATHSEAAARRCGRAYRLAAGGLQAL